MTNISISEEIATACPDLHVLALSCDVCNSEPDERLWQEIADEEKAVRETVKLEQINKWLPIQATRQAYKRLGKDPNRYRPSSEALRRRILRELPFIRSIRWSISSIWFLSVADIPSEASMRIKFPVAVWCWESAGKVKFIMESGVEN